MKKFALALLMLYTVPAIANDFYYEEYTSPDTEYMSYDMPATVRDNYIGARIHKNERISFGFDVRDGSDTTLKNDNVGFGLYVGNRLADFLKIEFETIYTGTDDTRRGIDMNFDIWSNMVNVYLFKTYGGAVEPYAGLGVGFSTIWSDIGGRVPSTSDTTFDLSYAAMVGVNFALNERVDVNMGIKYQKYGDADHRINGNTYATTDIDATEFFIGAAYKFSIK